MGDVCFRIRAPNNLCPLRPAYPFAHSDEQKADTEKQTPTGSGRDRQGLRMDGLRLGGYGGSRCHAKDPRSYPSARLGFWQAQVMSRTAGILKRDELAATPAASRCLSAVQVAISTKRL
jgi:hypothetical protein